MITAQKTPKFAAEKPKEEKNCYWWNPQTKSCRRGPDNCYYMQPVKPKKPKKQASPCEGCPFAIPLPCIGYCIKELSRGVGSR